jgi:hypothetical protein
MVFGVDVAVEVVKLQLSCLVLGAFFGEFGFELVFHLRGVGQREAVFGQATVVVGMALKIGFCPLFHAVLSAITCSFEFEYRYQTVYIR